MNVAPMMAAVRPTIRRVEFVARKVAAARRPVGVDPSLTRTPVHT
jgi:hypothetical protein